VITKDQANSILDAMQADDGEALQGILKSAIDSNQITRDQANSLLDAMQADDGDAVQSILSGLIGQQEQKPLALRPPEDFSPQLSDTDKALQMLFPRLTSVDAGQSFLGDIGKGVGDVASLPFRTLAGGASSLGTLLGGGNTQDVLGAYQEQMVNARATPNAGAVQGFAEDALKNPANAFLFGTGALAGNLTKGISNPLLRATLGGGAEGLLSGTAEGLMEQRGLKTEAMNTGINTLFGGALGGATSKLIPSNINTPTAPEVELLQGRVDALSQDPNANPDQLAKAMDELVQARESIATGDEVALPWYMPRDASGKMTPDRAEFEVPLIGERGRDVPFAQYQARASEVKSGLRTDDPFFMATEEVLVPAVDAVKKQQRFFGDKIGEIENRMGGVETNSTPIKSIVADELDKVGRRVVVKDVLDDNGEVVDQVAVIEWKPNIQRKGKQSSKALSPEMMQIAEEVSLLDDNVNFETLRSVVKDLEQVVKRTNTPDPLAQAMLKSLNAKFKDQIRGTIEATDPNLLTEWDEAMKGYAERSQLLGTIKRKAGDKFENAEGWLKSMVTTGARGSDEASRKIKEFTGYDIHKASGYARYANETAGIKERGASLLSEVGKGTKLAEQQAKKLPVLGTAVDAVKAVIPERKATAGTATRAVAQSQQKRVMEAQERENFFANYFRNLGALNTGYQEQKRK
jgi:hypothetical protein